MMTAPWKRSALVFSAVLLWMALPSARAAAGDVAVIVRPDTPVENLSFADLRDLVLGERQFWNSSLRVTLLVQAPGTRERGVILGTVCRMTESRFREYWISKIFRQEASSGPKVVYSDALAVDLVRAIPGSVAFVDADQVPKGLKTLRIGGKLPGEAGYPLK